jgi:hypothetical protein
MRSATIRVGYQNSGKRFPESQCRQIVPKALRTALQLATLRPTRANATRLEGKPELAQPNLAKLNKPVASPYESEGDQGAPIMMAAQLPYRTRSVSLLDFAWP